MASAVDIANIALGHLGDTATVASLDPPEGSAQAEHCARFYPIARDTMLSSHQWGFATRRKQLAQLGTPPMGWDFAYARPANAMDILAIRGMQEPDDGALPIGLPPHPFVCETTEDGQQVIYCNVENAKAHYIVRVEDPTLFPALFVTALTWHLASMLAGPLLKGDTGAAEAKRCAQMAQYYLGQAQDQDSNQRKTNLVHTPAWVRERAIDSYMGTNLPNGWRP